MLKELQNNVNYVYSGLAVIIKKDKSYWEKWLYKNSGIY